MMDSAAFKIYNDVWRRTIDSGYLTFCKNCSISFPDIQQIQIKSKLTNPYEEDIEPAISIVNIDYGKDIEIRHTPPIRGSFAELQKRGLKITHYHTTEKE